MSTEDHGVATLSIISPFGWVGGKKQLAKVIVSMIPPHRTYVEPFCGAASVFWAKEPSEVEVLNDVDPDLMRFYQDIGKVTSCDIVTISKDWDSLKAKEGKLEVCELLAQVNCSFGLARGAKAKPLDPQGKPQRLQCYNNAPTFHANLPRYQERLKTVSLHNEDWESVVKRYDSPETFFYFDPPYHGTSRTYRYSEDQLARLGQVLPKLKGKWLLTYDDHPEVREAFSGFNVMAAKSKYTVRAGPEQTIGEQLIITNYSVEAGMGEDNSMLRYQYRTILDQLVLLQLHAEDPDCPCSLKGDKQGELGEYCEPKHLRAVVALARETIAMESDRARLEYLERLVAEGSVLLESMERKLCGEEVDIGEYVTATREWRKPLEDFYYSGFCRVAPAQCLPPVVCIADYVASREAELHGVAGDIGSAIITGVGVGVGFKIADWVAKRTEAGKAEAKEVIAMGDKVDKGRESKAGMGAGEMAQYVVREVRLDGTSQVEMVIHGKEKVAVSQPADIGLTGHPLYDDLFHLTKWSVENWTSAGKIALSSGDSRKRILKSIRHYRKNKQELETYFDDGEDTDRIQSQYNTTWLEAAILGFAMRLRWTPAELERELDYVCGVGPPPRYKGASTHPVGIAELGAEVVSDEQSSLEAGKSYLDFHEGKRIWELAVKMKEEGKELDESPTGKDVTMYDLSPYDQAAWYTGSYYADKEGSIGGRSKLELAEIYAELVRDIDGLRGLSQEKPPYARSIPKEVIVYKTTIEKHYRPTSAFHRGSIRVTKPEEYILIYLGCLKKDRWDASGATCTPNPTIALSIVPNSKKYRKQLDHLLEVHPEIKVTYREKEVGVEPKVSSGATEETPMDLKSVIKAMEKAEEVVDA